MAQKEQWTLTMERQPHRDAVERLRAAYRYLRLAAVPSSATRPSGGEPAMCPEPASPPILQEETV